MMQLEGSRCKAWLYYAVSTNHPATPPYSSHPPRDMRRKLERAGQIVAWANSTLPRGRTRAEQLRGWASGFFALWRAHRRVTNLISGALLMGTVCL